MKYEDFKKEFDEIFGNITDEELVKSFAQMGCEVEIIPRVLIRCQTCRSDQYGIEDELFVNCPTCSPHHPKFHQLVD